MGARDRGYQYCSSKKSGDEPIWYPSPVCTQAHDFFVVNKMRKRKSRTSQPQGMVIPWVVVSGYLVTHEARRFKDPLLGTFVPCSVLGKELCAHAMIRMIRARQPKCKIDLYDLLALLALYLDSAACTGSLIKKAFPTDWAQLRNANSIVIIQLQYLQTSKSPLGFSR